MVIVVAVAAVVVVISVAAAEVLEGLVMVKGVVAAAADMATEEAVEGQVGVEQTSKFSSMFGFSLFLSLFAESV